MYKHLSGPVPKNIVLLSDGTGNSAAKVNKTNVWRLYQALDLAPVGTAAWQKDGTRREQIAMYDNGVGTSSFRPLALLGGGLGFGLKRNVLQLYEFACQNYVPATGKRPADRLFLFGFSRGAFTARVLAGLIASQGLIPDARGQELDRLARWAYRRYRMTFETMWHVKLFMWAVYFVIWLWDRIFHHGEPLESPATIHGPEITFLGLWDTVDAYGLPIDEMTTGWDRFVWPLSLRDRTPLPQTRRIRHAMALDDERLSFHPVLYTEVVDPAAKSVDPPDLQQVWFCGMHSDVGGGYPDDGMAHIPLRWMAVEAERAGLRLLPGVKDEWRARANDAAPMHNSRSGLALFYRYKPRRVTALCNDAFDHVSIPRPKIHDSVFQRIISGRDDYAPIVLPPDYDIVTDSGAILGPEDNPYETGAQAAQRVTVQDKVWRSVRVRRALYFLSVGVTTALLAWPFLPPAVGARFAPYASRTLTLVVEGLRAFLPDVTRIWTDHYVLYPVQLFVFLALLTGCWLMGRVVESRLRSRMLVEWKSILSHPPTDEMRAMPVPPAGTSMWSKLAASRASQTLLQLALPFLFGLVSLCTVVLLGLAALSYAEFAVRGVMGGVCRADSPVIPSAWSGEAWSATFASDAPCARSAITLEKDQSYRVAIAIDDGMWMDASHPVTSAAGFGTFDHGLSVFPIGLPFRRHLTVRWFVPEIRIGDEHFGEVHALTDDPVTITPRVTGPAWFFVNDAVLFWPYNERLYRNNAGSATVTITPLD